MPPYFSSDGDGEFIHMDDSGAMLLGLRVIGPFHLFLIPNVEIGIYKVYI